MKKLLILWVVTILMLNADGLQGNIDERAVGKYKSESTARAWSIEATVIPIALGIFPGGYVPQIGITIIGASLVISPSTGHFYAGQWGRGLKTIGLRMAIVGIGTGLFIAQTSTEETEVVNTGQTVTCLMTGAALVASAIYDIKSTSLSARKYNEQLGKTGNLELSPIIDVADKRYGLAFTYHF